MRMQGPETKKTRALVPTLASHRRVRLFARWTMSNHIGLAGAGAAGVGLVGVRGRACERRAGGDQRAGTLGGSQLTVRDSAFQLIEALPAQARRLPRANPPKGGAKSEATDPDEPAPAAPSPPGPTPFARKWGVSLRGKFPQRVVRVELRRRVRVEQRLRRELRVIHARGLPRMHLLQLRGREREVDGLAVRADRRAPWRLRHADRARASRSPAHRDTSTTRSTAPFAGWPRSRRRRAAA